MNTAKLVILEETLKNSFNIDRYRKFTRELFNKLDMYPESRQTGIWKEYEQHISAYYRIGNYIDSDENKILIMAVELRNQKSVERARSMQRNFISRVLDENNLDAAIVAFYSEGEPSWRLSLVRLDYTFTDKGLNIDLTPAKRYSYLVGKDEPSYTAQTQLLKILENDITNPTLDEIEDKFSVEKVTKDFFIQYKEKYLDLKEYLENNDEFIIESEKLGFKTEKFAEQFAKKLMGQLAFLYFLQKKGWLGVKIVPKSISKQELTQVYNSVDNIKKKMLKKVYQNNEENEDKYELDIEFISSHQFSDHEAGILSDIFVSNEKYNESWGSGYRKFIRDVLWKHCNKSGKNFFNDYLEPFFYEALNKKRKNQYFKTFNSKIPFLNGGLFEPLEGYHWKDTNFDIPNDFFSNQEEKLRESNGILDIFDRYNFTINENEPLEKEVAVDPEMLGKIFENLLDVNDRKSKGAFYTPREIVHYMCQESLINYLIKEVNVPYEDMKQFILYGEFIKDADSRSFVSSSTSFHENKTIKQSIFDNIVNIDNALENVKIADPAVGSGAFPLGMLNEIVRARNNITEYIIRKDKEGVFGRKHGEKFIREWRSPYKIKWNTIKNSIFAVDIEASAVDITKLRLWLSVIVDQEINEEYKEPKPLPNLDMNIHVGNSLIDEFEGIKLFDETILKKLRSNKQGQGNNPIDKGMQLNILIDHTDEMISEMFDLQDRYFEIDNEERKKEIKNKIDNIQEQLIRYKLDKEGNIEGLKRYQQSVDNKTKPYFIWELEFGKVFKDKGGFDIVIGNPPYIDSEEMTKKLEDTREYCKAKYSFAKGNWDIYIVFFELGFNMLNKKGIQAYITPDKWISKPFGESMREKLIGNIHTILKAGRKVFEMAKVDAIITLISKESTEKVSIFEFINGDAVFKREVNKEILTSPYALDILFSNHINIINKMNKNALKFSDEFECENACATSDAYKIKPFLKTLENKTEYNQTYMKIINTGTIGKYTMRWGKKEMTYLKDKYLFPVVSKEEFIQAFNNTYSAKSIKPKIIIKSLTLLDSCLDLKGEVIPGKSTMLVCHNDPEKLKYLLGLLNSKLIFFYIKEKYSSSSYNGGINFNKKMINDLPYINMKDDERKSIISHVDKIIEIKESVVNEHSNKEDEQVKYYQLQIDNIIYKSYGITKEEVLEIEKQIKF